MRTLHVTIGADVDVDEFLTHNVGHTTEVHWPVRKTAQVGDDVVFLIPSMSGDFVARGQVATAPVLRRWKNRQQYGIAVANVEPLSPRVPIWHLHEMIPEWPWTGYARSFTAVPEEFVEQFWDAIRSVPRSYDFETPPGRHDVRVSRIIRDTGAAMKLKRKYGFACQICGLTFVYGNDKHYIETHHLRPLGAPHHGPDTPANMLVLCPNHHAMFDLRMPRFLSADTVEIEGKQHRLAMKHKLAQSHVAYYMTSIRSSES